MREQGRLQGSPYVELVVLKLWNGAESPRVDSVLVRCWSQGLKWRVPAVTGTAPPIDEKRHAEGL